MAKEKVNYQEVYDLYQLCSETKDLREFCADYGVKPLIIFLLTLPMAVIILESYNFLKKCGASIRK